MLVFPISIVFRVELGMGFVKLDPQNDVRDEGWEELKQFLAGLHSNEDAFFRPKISDHTVGQQKKPRRRQRTLNLCKNSYWLEFGFRCLGFVRNRRDGHTFMAACVNRVMICFCLLFLYSFSGPMGLSNSDY